MKTKTNPALNKTFRYTVAWILLGCIVFFSSAAILYNSNAVMMAFGKGVLHFRTFSDLIEKVESQPTDYVILDASQIHSPTPSFSYRSYDHTTEVEVCSQEDTITEIQIHLNQEKFLMLNFLDQYASIDQTLRPLLKSRDVLAAEIAIVQYASQYAIQFKMIDFPESSTIYANDFTLEMQNSPESILFKIFPLPH